MLTAAETRAQAMARGLRLKRANSLAALLCGGLPMAFLSFLHHASAASWFIGFAIGLFWASGFEYLYHRFLLHLPGTSFALSHHEHHSSLGMPNEAEHVNLGGSPLFVVALFVLNGLPVVAFDLALGLRLGPGIFLAFTAYFVLVEEIHWRIHLGGWLPPVLRQARPYHLTHHTRPRTRFNICVPLWDLLLGSTGR